MTRKEKNLVLDALVLYRDEHSLDGLSMDNDFKYYDYDEDGEISYQTWDAETANSLANLIEMFS
jgi:hypothetical protein